MYEIGLTTKRHLKPLEGGRWGGGGYVKRQVGQGTGSKERPVRKSVPKGQREE